MDKDRLIYLWRCYVNDTSSDIELQELKNALHDADLQDLIDEALTDIYQTLPPRDIIDMTGTDAKDSSFQAIISHAQERYPFIHWLRYGAAAIVLLCLGIAALFFYHPSGRKQDTHTVVTQDVLPGSNKAMITNSDGKTISLSGSKDALVLDGGVWRYGDGTEVSGDEPSSRGVQTVSTPRGGTYQVILPDKTKVWLNAASSIRFSPAFDDPHSREVFLKGEAYFEVSKDKKRPFIVVMDKQRVTVLGTHFNINGYTDEPAVKTTLIEGSVGVSGLHKSDIHVLQPGQQSEVKNDGIRIQKVDIDQVVDWKNGYFKFVEEDMGSIMRKIARWYDMDIQDVDLLPEGGFSGRISRNKNLSQVLRMIEEASGSVQFKIEERRIIVTR
ncbi:DUF4974 domain-containing protein [Sphingobacterium olei]|uniref:DUF4974 domain-containing protein n=1 Tax=Sphingobacterium olei TaxID=2571155 RepID=A0A4U0P0J0_9SPHI|nr:FecR family protein [Sphingobacterium olei]TJZ60022.1 DUF4974 domain-containing protein [Sphingobacterium olei]